MSFANDARNKALAVNLIKQVTRRSTQIDVQVYETYCRPRRAPWSLPNR